METCFLHQCRLRVDDLLFFSDFDSGNLARVLKTTCTSFELWVSPDAYAKGYNNYRVWFYFGVRGLHAGTQVQFTIMNLSCLRLFAWDEYRPVCRALPSAPEWQRVSSEVTYEPNYAGYYRLSWSYQVRSADNDLFFAFTVPYPYCEILKSVHFFSTVCPRDSVFLREILSYSLDHRPIELLTISHKSNFLEEREAVVPGAFPTGQRVCRKAKKPIVFISARVHPGETPGSFVLDGFLQALLSPDPRSVALRRNFVFKIVPVVNPDGVARGHYRVDQRGVNLNRCYQSPSLIEHPTVFAVKNYFEYTSRVHSVCFFMDLHAHASKKACFLFGNYFNDGRCADNQLFAKLVHLNSAYFEYSDCDFSERSMRRKDPKDQHSKEGSARVAYLTSTGIVCSYTIEAAYYLPRVLHTLTPLVNAKTGNRQLDKIYVCNKALILVFNRAFFDDVGSSLAFSILDFFQISPVSRIRTTQYRTVTNVRDSIKTPSEAGRRGSLHRTNSRSAAKPKGEVRTSNRFIFSVNTAKPKPFELPLAPTLKKKRAKTVAFCKNSNK